MKPQSRFTRIALFAIVLFFLMARAFGQQTSTPDALSQLSESLLALTEKVAPAVVEIQVVGYGPDKDDDDAKASLYKQHATGSGVILGSDGYIITNAHVIKGAKRICVVLNNTTDSKVPAGIIQDAVTRFDAVVVGAHEDMDLAVLKIQATGLPTIVLADSADLRQGQVVIAVGNPMGMRSSVSQGVVSAVARQRSEDKPMVLIQTDALVSPGSSGGALVDTKGRLVGIICQTMTGHRLGFAVPSDAVKFVYEQIRQHGVVHRGDIGADVQNINFVLATALKLPCPWGVIVADVRAGSQAEKAGLKPFDAILSMDGKRIVSFPQFDTALYFKRAGEQITLEIARQGATMTIRVPVGDRSSIPDAEAMLGADPEKSLIPRLGIIGKDVNREMAAKDPGVRDFSGVIVLGTTPDLQDLDCDLIVGDIIHSVNGQPIPDIVSLRKIMQTFKSGDAIALRIERRHRFMYVAFESE